MCQLKQMGYSLHEVHYTLINQKTVNYLQVNNYTPTQWDTLISDIKSDIRNNIIDNIINK